MSTFTRGGRVWLAATVMALIAGGWYAVETATYEFQPQTSIAVRGTSTMHDFECKAGLISGAIQVPITGSTDVADALNGMQTVSVSVPVEKIDCGNGTMDKKMKSALDAGKAPLIKYTLTRATVTGPADASGFYPMNTSGRLALAGQEKPIEMAVRGKQLADGSFLFSGSTQILMKDWGISPPTAMLGAMKTGNEVTVVFEAVAAN